MRKFSNTAEYKLFTPTRREIDLVKDRVLLYLFTKQKNINCIIHLAHPRITTTTTSLAEATIMMHNILEVCRILDLSLIYSSSLVVFSGYLNNHVIKADFKPKPRGVYSESKFLCEQLIEAYNNTYGLKSAILRLSYIYGPCMDKSKVIVKFILNAQQNKPIKVHKYLNGFQTFDFLFIDDVADAFLCTTRIMEAQNISSIKLNIGTGIGTSTYELAKIIKDICYSSSEIEVISINDYCAHLVPDVTEANNKLLWKAKIPLNKGIKELCASLNNYKMN
jgi:nucleoside-diphosphate-sugar epimerase